MSAQLQMGLAECDTQDRRCRLIVLIAVVAALSLIAVAWQSVKARQTAHITEQIDQGRQASQLAAVTITAASNQPDDVIVTTLSQSGFSPTELSHPPGHFNLRVNNQSGLPKITLSLSKSNGEKLTEVPLTDKVRWVTAEVDLAPGSYTLTVANHADWTCIIEVPAQ